MTIMGAYNYLEHAQKDVSSVKWIPVASISFYVFSAYIGLLPLVFVIIMEVLPAKVNMTQNYFRYYHFQMLQFIQNTGP